MIKIFTHTHFGDQFTNFGFLKEFSYQYDKMILTIEDKPWHIENVTRLYSSIKNLELTTERFSDNEYDKVFYSQWWFEQVKPWLENPQLPYTLGDNMRMDRFWYNIAQVPLYKKWDNFNFERDLKKEKEVYYDVFGLKDNQQFIFMHENIGIPAINRKYINNMYQCIELTKYLEISPLDILYTIEKAKEIHVINGACLAFIDVMQINHNNLFYHKYTRPCPVEQVALRLNWKIIE